jgi:hypothetical protein
MKKLTSATIAAACMTSVALVPAATASALIRDCRIFGPAYVSEVVDCVFYIYETAIG